MKMPFKKLIAAVPNKAAIAMQIPPRPAILLTEDRQVTDFGKRHVSARFWAAHYRPPEPENKASMASAGGACCWIGVL